jgi:predicted enzyme related to lactoylglutathione lyase
MANAIITDDFRRSQVELLIDQMTATKTATETGYFIGLGKSDPWNSTDTAPVPTGSEYERKEALQNLMTLARIENNKIFRLVPKTNQLWQSGVQFKRYDSSDPTCFNASASQRGCYAHYENKLYLCLSNGSGDGVTVSNTTNNPTVSSTIGIPGENTGTDNYIWVNVGDLSTSADFYESLTFLQIPGNLTDATARQNANKNSAGLLYGFKIISGGTGYTASQSAAAATLSFTRVDGTTGAVVQLTVKTNSSGVITNVQDTSGNSLNLADFQGIGVGAEGTNNNGLSGAGGLGIKDASLQITGAGNPTATAVIEPLIGPPLGFAVDDTTSAFTRDRTGNLDVFPPFYLGLSYDFVTGTTGDALTDTSFRQVTLVKNPTRTADTGDTTIETMDSLKQLTTTGGMTGFTPSSGATTEGWYLKFNASPGQQAWIDKIVGNNIYYHQNNVHSRTSSGTTKGSTQNVLPSSGTISIYNSSDVLQSSAITVNGTVAAEHNENTGEVIFLENRTGITRTGSQTEKARIILQF